MESAMLRPDEEELAQTCATIVTGLIMAHQHGDRDAVAKLLAQLLVVTAKYASPERQRDAAANRAVEFTHH